VRKADRLGIRPVDELTPDERRLGEIVRRALTETRENVSLIAIMTERFSALSEIVAAYLPKLAAAIDEINERLDVLDERLDALDEPSRDRR
jgi:hypothetical protein